ncbi:MAG: helix-turn-helix domain-containing protein [Oscillospiraceae bacterium]|nr:helix-turn-helix domain-containing protein [Oscillospiraceae bacterium]MDD6982077.1 helix-turn-helix transcriptional regulator [Oscillospiraceae bacterium]
MSNNTVGERLRAAREMAGLTQKAVADQLEIPRQVISYFENDIRNPNIKTLTILANIYGTSTDFLLDCTDVSTQNADLRAICDYTGLNEEAITVLHIAKMLAKNPSSEISTDYTGYHSHLSNFITITYPQISKLLAQLNAKAETARKALIDETEGMKDGTQIKLPIKQADEMNYYDKHKTKNTNAETLFFEARHTMHDILDEFCEYIEDTCCEYKDMILAKREHTRQKLENELIAEFKSGDNNGNDN